MVINRNTLFKLMVFFLSIALFSCKSGQQKESKEVDLEQLVSEEEIFNDIDNAKKIFYSLPSPLETAMLLKSAGADYDEDLLNSLGNVSNYTTSKAMALNLGIYTTDLSFASLFDQTQTAIKYMTAARSMAEGLDVSDAIDNQTIQDLQDNLNNRDVVMDIISETFLNSSAYLKENEREDVAAIVLVGGWIEGLFVASEIIGDQSIEDNELADRVLEQKLSFNILERLLEENKTNVTGEENVDIVALIKDLEPLKQAFDKVKVETTEPQVEQNTESDVSTIKSQTKTIVSAEDFKQLQTVVKDLRTSFIQ
ncbi:MAG: hypothetical protein MI922_03160 [Bacteroidales bacterium]|nr:hypothetical protein [Bacteroidales bacterium]